MSSQTCSDTCDLCYNTNTALVLKALTMLLPHVLFVCFTKYYGLRSYSSNPVDLNRIQVCVLIPNLAIY